MVNFGVSCGLKADSLGAGTAYGGDRSLALRLSARRVLPIVGGALGEGQAVRAAARKVARLIYALLTKGQAYVDFSRKITQEHQQRAMHKSRKRALAMRFTVRPVEATAS